MDEAQQRTGFKGDRKAFFEFLKKDKRFYYPTKEALLAGFRDIAKRIDPQLPPHFKTLPRLTYGVEAMPDYQAKTSPAAFYEPGAPEVGRAGNFMANTYDLKSRPKWAMEDLTLHEAVPGHHLQIARAQELGDLPKFRRYTFYNAFGEGWALYCESLGDELGLYNDPYSGKFRAAQRRDVASRAAGQMGVDTGIHAQGWTSRAGHRLLPRPHRPARAECPRRRSTGYIIVLARRRSATKIGCSLDIKAPARRLKAEDPSKDRFDEREFHDQIPGRRAPCRHRRSLDQRIHD